MYNRRIKIQRQDWNSNLNVVHTASSDHVYEKGAHRQSLARPPSRVVLASPEVRRGPFFPCPEVSRTEEIAVSSSAPATEGDHSPLFRAPFPGRPHVPTCVHPHVSATPPLTPREKETEGDGVRER